MLGSLAIIINAASPQPFPHRPILAEAIAPEIVARAEKPKLAGTRI